MFIERRILRTTYKSNPPRRHGYIHTFPYLYKYSVLLLADARMIAHYSDRHFACFSDAGVFLGADILSFQ